MVCIGIDPGKNGGFAIIDVEELALSSVEAYPMDEKSLVDSMRFVSEAFSKNEIRCCLERVGAMPEQGVTSMFTFGAGYGFIQGVLTAYGIPYQVVPPQTWKKAFSLNSNKQTSIEVCQRLFPNISLYRTERCRRHEDHRSGSSAYERGALAETIGSVRKTNLAGPIGRMDNPELMRKIADAIMNHVGAGWDGKPKREEPEVMTSEQRPTKDCPWYSPQIQKEQEIGPYGKSSVRVAKEHDLPEKADAGNRRFGPEAEG